jgi:hypothetical protein
MTSGCALSGSSSSSFSAGFKDQEDIQETYYPCPCPFGLYKISNDASMSVRSLASVLVRRRLSTMKGSQCPWRGHLFMFLNFHFIQLSVC